MKPEQVNRLRQARESEPMPMYGRRQLTQPRAMAGAYDGANTDAYSSRWGISESTPDAELSQALPILRARSADLVRNNSLAYGIIDTIQQGVIGRGPRFRSSAEDVGNPEVAAQIDKLFEDWKRVAGWDGVSVWSDVCDDLISSACISGDVLVIWPDVGDGSAPCVDLIDARRIDTPSDKTPECDTCRLGVGYDKYGRTLGYYVRKSDEGGSNRESFRWFPLTRNGRVNARLFKRPSLRRPRQSRAVGILAPMLHGLKEIPSYLLTENRRATQASKIHTIISTPDPKAISDAFENVTTDSGDSQLDTLLGRSYGNTPDGSMMVLGIGETAQLAQPPQVNGGIDQYVSAHLKVASAGTGLPHEEVFNLYAGMNFSNARTVRLKAKAVYRKWRDKVEDALGNPTISLLVMYWWANGLLGRIPWSDALMAGKWHWDEMEWVDPMKEATANTEAIDTDQKSLQSVTASQGTDWRAIIAENVEAEAYREELRKAKGLPPKSAAAQAVQMQDDSEDDAKQNHTEDKNV